MWKKKTESQLKSILFLSLSYEKPSAYVLIYFHSNAEDLGGVYKYMKLLRDGLKMHIIAAEFPGYGIAEGKPSATSLNECALQIYQHVRDVLKWPSHRIIVCGRSIGTGPATKLASDQPVAGLILVSPFTSLKNVAKHTFGFIGSFLAPNYWDNIDAIKKVQCPILLIHGKDDSMIPSDHSRTLYDNCTHLSGRRTLRLVNGCGHNNLTWRSIVRYFEEFIAENGLTEGKKETWVFRFIQGTWLLNMREIFTCVKDES